MARARGPNDLTTMRFQFALAIMLAGAAWPLPAQSMGRAFIDDLAWAGRDFGAVWLSPFTGNSKDYLVTGAVLVGGALASPWDDQVDGWAVRNHEGGLLARLGPVRRGGRLYTLNKTTPYVGAAYVVALALNKRGFRDGVMGCASAYAAGSSMRHLVVYPLLGRNRPDTVRDRPEGTVGPPATQGDQYEFKLPSDGWPTHSFPGGHIATMTACASFFAHRYDAKYLDPVLIVLVTAMGVGRIADRGHWLSDQLIGVAMGYAIGREVARRQLKRLDEDHSPPTTVSAEASGLLHTQRDERTLIGWRIVF
jgi:membrane-associated phospholipid phosphatase